MFKQKQRPLCIDCKYFRPKFGECWHPKLAIKDNVQVWKTVHHPLVTGVKPPVTYQRPHAISQRSNLLFGCTFRGRYFEPIEEPIEEE